jgi:DNA-binding Lrp family transcriptional regulator
MPVIAYVLIQVKGSKAEQIAEDILKLEGIRMAHSVTGMYDIIAYVEVDDLGAIAELVRKIHEVDGIERTHTAISA